MTLLAAVVLVGLGFLIGAFGTLVGAGGGFLLVPLLVLGYGFAPADAAGTSLSLVFLNALSGSAAYLRQRRVDRSLGRKFAAATVPGAAGGAYLTRLLSARAFVLAFAILLLVIAALLFIGVEVRPSSRAGLRSIVDAGGETHHYRIDVWKCVVLSFAAGESTNRSTAVLPRAH